MPTEHLLSLIAMHFMRHPTFLFLFVILTVAIWTDGAILFWVVYAYNYGIDMWIIVLAAYIGAWVIDAFCFIFARRILSLVSSGRPKKLHTLFSNNLFLTILVSKFTFGVGTLTMFYLSRKISFAKFQKYNSIALVIWTIVMTLVGHLIALGFSYLRRFVEDAGIILLLLALVIIMFILFEKEIYALFEKASFKKNK